MIFTHTFNTSCAHEQKTHGLQSINVANKTVFVTLPSLGNACGPCQMIWRTRTLQSTIPHTYFASVLGVVRELHIVYIRLTISTMHHVCMSREHMACSAVGTVNGRGYDGQQVHTIYLWCSWAVPTNFWLICYAYNFLRCVDVEIWRF